MARPPVKVVVVLYRLFSRPARFVSCWHGSTIGGREGVSRSSVVRIGLIIFGGGLEDTLGQSEYEVSK